MGCIYRRKDSKAWWIGYVRAGKPYRESSGSERKGDARDLLRLREGDIAHGKPVTPKIGRLKFEDAAKDLIADYSTNGKRSLGVVQRRIVKHLAPHFEGARMASITTSDVRAYIVKRQTEDTVLVRKARTVTMPDGTQETTAEQRRPASNAEINRELALLKRMYSLALQAGKLLHRPHIPMLREDNTRTGFFEPEQYRSVLARLPEAIQPVIAFAYITGWRVTDEILPLEWRQVDLAAGEVRLDAGTTKNSEGRVFPVTSELRVLLTARLAEHERLKKQGHIVPQVFFRLVAKERGGEKTPVPIVSFIKAWRSACRAAGCPGRIPHDLRRTAIRSFVRKGIPERVAMQMSGHKTRSVFERYNIVSDGDLKDAARKLDAGDAVRQTGTGK